MIAKEKEINNILTDIHHLYDDIFDAMFASPVDAFIYFSSGEIMQKSIIYVAFSTSYM
jgi:hypothetical protein